METSHRRWRLHSVSHSWHNPSLRWDFHTPGSGGLIRHVRAGCGLQEDGRSAEVTTLISDASLHCIVHCAPTWRAHCEDAEWGFDKGWLFSKRESAGSSLPVCVRGVLSSVNFTPLEITIINDDTVVISGQCCLWQGKWQACFWFASCFSSLKWILMLP